MKKPNKKYGMVYWINPAVTRYAPTPTPVAIPRPIKRRSKATTFLKDA
jgi:hypothetical protein